MRDFFICEHCGESFDEIRPLKKHECEATGTISTCDDCDFASNDVPSIEHREAHKPVHQCQFCEYEATDRKAGTEHRFSMSSRPSFHSSVYPRWLEE